MPAAALRWAAASAIAALRSAALGASAGLSPSSACPAACPGLERPNMSKRTNRPSGSATPEGRRTQVAVVHPDAVHGVHRLEQGQGMADRLGRAGSGIRMPRGVRHGRRRQEGAPEADPMLQYGREVGPAAPGRARRPVHQLQQR